jgi:hypothetical protein
MCQEIQDANSHSQLQDDLVEHLWMLKRKHPSFIFGLLFIWISNYELFLCMNYALNNLYGSSGAISSRLDAQAGMLYFQNFGPNLHKSGLL